MELKELGLTEEKLQDLIVERACELILDTSGYDEDGSEFRSSSSLNKRLKKLASETADAKVAALFDEHILPRVEKFVEELTLQTTNKWGEAKGEEVTFIEYLIARAEKYLVEDVDYKGKAKREGDSYSWRKNQSRISHMVHEHLQYSISTAMKKAMQVADKSIAAGIAGTVKIQLAQVLEKLKVEVKT